MILLDPEQVLAARQGSRAALDALLRAAERPIYNLALRMLAHPADAEDVTQEILIKIVTHLGAVRDAEAAGAWAMRVACRHLVRERKRGRVEAMNLTFDTFTEDLAQGQRPLDDLGLSDAEANLAVQEVKIGCTLAMLTCLSRDLRMAYILGDVLELSDSEAASVLEVSPAAYRQRLRRARASVTAFTAATCGIVSEHAPCRCDRRVGAAMRQGRVGRGVASFGAAETDTRADFDSVRETVQALDGSRAAAALMRSNPNFTTNVRDLALKTIGTEGEDRRS